MTEETIDQLFAAFDRLYGRHWHHRCRECGWGDEIGGQWQSFDRDHEWLNVLAHLTEAHVRSGIQMLDEQATQLVAEGKTVWPPDSALLFSKGCRVRPEVLGWPTREQAWRQVQQNAFVGTAIDHEAVRAAMTGVDTDALRVATYEQMGKYRQLFLSAYESVINRAIAGEPIENRAALEDRNRVNQAEAAMRAGEEKAAKMAAEHKGPSGIAGLRAALGRN
ncbi:hypothetical protein M1D97_10435 [Kushneria sp. AK178]